MLLLNDYYLQVPQLEKKRLYRGRGGAAIRQAACDLMRSMAEAAHPISERLQLRLVKSLFEQLAQPRAETQAAAVAALAALARASELPPLSATPIAASAASGTAAAPAAAASSPPEHWSGLPLRLIKLLRNENVAVRRGAALALGGLPAHVLRHNGDADVAGEYFICFPSLFI